MIEQAKPAGVYTFGGGINESVEPEPVAAIGLAAPKTYPSNNLDGVFTVLELLSWQDAE